jgi:hypothetical protein
LIEQINQENGYKGYILMLEYKNFIFKNIISKYSRKSNLYKKSKNLTGNINSETINYHDTQNI